MKVTIPKSLFEYIKAKTNQAMPPHYQTHFTGDTFRFFGPYGFFEIDYIDDEKLTEPTAPVVLRYKNEDLEDLLTELDI